MGKDGEAGWGKDMVRKSMGGAGEDLLGEETTGIPAKVPDMGVKRRVLGALKDRCWETGDKRCAGIEGIVTRIAFIVSLGYISICTSASLSHCSESDCGKDLRCTGTGEYLAAYRGREHAKSCVGRMCGFVACPSTRDDGYAHLRIPHSGVHSL